MVTYFSTFEPPQNNNTPSSSKKKKNQLNVILTAPEKSPYMVFSIWNKLLLLVTFHFSHTNISFKEPQKCASIFLTKPGKHLWTVFF